MKYSEETVEKLIDYAIDESSLCPYQLGLKDEDFCLYDLPKHKTCVDCWQQALAGEDK
jgi:hypothetical protein